MLKAHVVAHLMTEGVVSRSAIAQIELNADESMSDYPACFFNRNSRARGKIPSGMSVTQENPIDPLGPPMNQIGKDFSFTVIEQRRH